MDKQIQLSAGHIDVTPKSPIYLSGYSSRKTAINTVSDPIEINAAVFRHKNQTAIVVSGDFLYFTDNIKEKVINKLKDSFPINHEYFFLAASHTHFAPDLDSLKCESGKFNPIYVEWVSGCIVKLLTRLLEEKGHHCHLQYSKGRGDHAINRRRTGWVLNRRQRIPKYSVAILPNSNGPKDETIHVLQLIDERGLPLAILWNYACHPVGFPGRNNVSADFPGIVRERIRKEFNNPYLPVLFLQGFSGNIRPCNVNNGKSFKFKLLNIIQKGPVFGKFSEQSFNNWSNGLADQVIHLIQLKNQQFLRPNFRFSQKRIPLKKLILGGMENQFLTIQNFTLSTELTILGLSAEPVVEYVEVVKKAFKGRNVIPVGYINSVFGYLPTDEIIKEGGYEAGDFFGNFGLKGKFKVGIKKYITQAITAISK